MVMTSVMVWVGHLAHVCRTKNAPCDLPCCPFIFHRTVTSQVEGFLANLWTPDFQLSTWLPVRCLVTVHGDPLRGDFTE